MSDDDDAFPRLTEQQVGRLEPHGQRRAFEPGETLISEGDLVTDLPVILAGTVEILDGDRVLSVAGPRQFLGEIGLLTGQTSFVTACAAERGELLNVPVDRLRDVVVRDAGDVRSGAIKRVASAVGEGAMAVRLIHAALQTNISSTKHQRPSSPGSNERTIA
jgi:thioredoxin reductase (NADPH)